jgi:N-acetylmuramoyl-L-alanine amidase
MFGVRFVHRDDGGERLIERGTMWIVKASLVAIVLMSVPTPGWSEASSEASSLYEQARSGYVELMSSSEKKKYRHHWFKVMDAFSLVLKKSNTSQEAVNAAFTLGTLWRALYDVSRRPSDEKEALVFFAKVISSESCTAKRVSSRLVDDAYYQRAEIYERQGNTKHATESLVLLVRHCPNGDMHPKAKILLAKWRQKRNSTFAFKNKESKTQPAATKQTKVSPPLKQRAKSTRHILLDPGHGGKDHGATAKSGLSEKEVVLAIALFAQHELRKRGLEVSLTRRDDIFLSLPRRSSMARELGADLFVSIHANSHPQSSARGIETYYLDVTDDRYAKRLASVENKEAGKDIGQLGFILADLTNKAATHDSIRLSHSIQNQLLKGAKRLNPNVRDLGVKGALFYVLMGVQVPSALVETSFLSNPKEAALLKKKTYRQMLAKNIAQGVVDYFRLRSSKVDL